MGFRVSFLERTTEKGFVRIRSWGSGFAFLERVPYYYCVSPRHPKPVAGFRRSGLLGGSGKHGLMAVLAAGGVSAVFVQRL